VPAVAASIGSLFLIRHFLLGRIRAVVVCVRGFEQVAERRGGHPDRRRPGWRGLTLAFRRCGLERLAVHLQRHRERLDGRQQPLLQAAQHERRGVLHGLRRVLQPLLARGR
jgi:hypothetical protein